MRREHFILDKASDRYRECRYCGESFMTNHRLRFFCDNGNWCHDQYNNELKREKKLKVISSVTPIENTVPQDIKAHEPDDLEEVKTWVPNNKPSPVKDFGSLEQNIAACMKLNIPSGKSLFMPIENIHKYGINPDKFSRRVPIVSDDSQPRYILEFGDFGFTFTNFTVVSIFWLRDLYNNN